MARTVFVFALVMVAIIGMASAQAPKVPLKAAHAPVEAMAPTGSGGDDNTVGPIDDAPSPSGSSAGGDDAAVAGSVGGPVAAEASGDDSSATAPAPSGASALEVSAAAAAAAVAVAGYFF